MKKMTTPQVAIATNHSQQLLVMQQQFLAKSRSNSMESKWNSLEVESSTPSVSTACPRSLLFATILTSSTPVVVAVLARAP